MPIAQFKSKKTRAAYALCGGLGSTAIAAIGYATADSLTLIGGIIVLGIVAIATYSSQIGLAPIIESRLDETL